MSLKSQTSPRLRLILLVVLCAIPSCAEAYAIIWGQRHGLTGKALRDGLDFWAGGFLALHGHLAMAVQRARLPAFPRASNTASSPIISGATRRTICSSPPDSTGSPPGTPCWPSMRFPSSSSLASSGSRARAGWLIAAVLASPACLENILEHQNAALLTALIGGGLLLLPLRPRLGGVLIGLATIKPQLGLVLPLFLLRRAPIARRLCRTFRRRPRRRLAPRLRPRRLGRLLPRHQPGS